MSEEPVHPRFVEEREENARGHRRKGDRRRNMKFLCIIKVKRWRNVTWNGAVSHVTHDWP